MMITEQKTHKFNGEQLMGTVQVSAGALLVEVEHGEGSGQWVQADNYTADFAGAMFFGYGNVRFTPSGGASINLYQG